MMQSTAQIFSQQQHKNHFFRINNWEMSLFGVGFGFCGVFFFFNQYQV